MMDEDTSWQDATLNTNDVQLIGPVRPADAELPALAVAGEDDEAGFDELETGIASIFAALHAASTGEPGDGAADDEDADPAFAEAHTFQLLGELDRLWQRAG